MSLVLAGSLGARAFPESCFGFDGSTNGKSQAPCETNLSVLPEKGARHPWLGVLPGLGG